MKFSTLVTLAAVVASPTFATSDVANLEKRAIWETCSVWGTITQGAFTVYQNLWGASSGTGSQCFYLDSVSGNTFAWRTTWSWSGGPYNVKSYDNIAYNFATGVRVNTISSIPSTWVWSQTGTNPVNNVAYDLMTTASGNVNDSHTYEIMIWVGAFGGAGPISSTGSPVATPNIAGYSWRLFDGWNGSMRVFSFVATSNILSFSGDLNLFLKYLAANNGFNTNHYLTVLQGGTEPFLGSNVVLTTTRYTVALNVGGTPASSSRRTTSTTRASSTRTSSTAVSGGGAPVWGQCGGNNWPGPFTCVAGSTCTFQNAWYSQCLPN